MYESQECALRESGLRATLPDAWYDATAWLLYYPHCQITRKERTQQEARLLFDFSLRTLYACRIFTKLVAPRMSVALHSAVGMILRKSRRSNGGKNSEEPYRSKKPSCVFAAVWPEAAINFDGKSRNLPLKWSACCIRVAAGSSKRSLAV